MKNTTSPRRLAFDMLMAVIADNESLSAVSPRLLPRLSEGRDRAFAYRLTLDTLRQLNRLAWMRDQLLERPFKGKDMDIAVLLLLGIAQLCDTSLATHASLHETVELARHFKKKPWAVGLINGVLRNFQRQQSELIDKANQQIALATAHPAWFVQQLQQAYPEHWQRVCQANNQPAALCLRLKPKLDVASYLQQLPESLEAQAHPHLSQAILLNSTDVTQLPGFSEGSFSVQDASAQWAAHLLQPKADERICDACAAPGGKTTHLLELSDNACDLTALDIEASRLQRIEENLARLRLNAKLQIADAADTAAWWDGQLFDAILLDAPCSATGIIRRHPDIKWHRKPADISVLNETQARLLDTLWPLVQAKGRLLYATCSVLPSENREQIAAFLARTPNAQLLHTPIPDAINTGFGQQLLPSHSRAGDGFFYALLVKQEAH